MNNHAQKKVYSRYSLRISGVTFAFTLLDLFPVYLSGYTEKNQNSYFILAVSAMLPCHVLLEYTQWQLLVIGYRPLFQKEKIPPRSFDFAAEGAQVESCCKQNRNSSQEPTSIQPVVATINAGIFFSKKKAKCCGKKGNFFNISMLKNRCTLMQCVLLHGHSRIELY